MNNTSIMRLYLYLKGNTDYALYIIVCTGVSAALNLSRCMEGSEGKPSDAPSDSTATGSLSRSNTANYNLNEPTLVQRERHKTH